MNVKQLFGLAGKRSAQLNLSPPTVLVLGYAFLVVAGAALLMLPISVLKPLSWSDALFTSASAVTVTGLVVVDTGSHFSVFGQIVIAVLIQLGGLGLMTMAVVVFSLLGLRMPIRQQLILSEDLNQTNLGGLVSLAWMILRIVLLVEAVGMLLLAVRFVPEFGWAEGLWQAAFHSVSALNNAGFALHADSLTRWVGDPIVNIVIAALFVTGGLGFAVVADLISKQNLRQLTLHSKLMLAGTVVLILWSFSAFLILEWSNPKTLGQLAIDDRIWAGWFQALTTRTAGFNTVDISGIRDSTALLLITLMVIGGGSTSTAGGLKVTTFMVLVLATYAFVRRREDVSAFGRRLPPSQTFKVLALTTLCLITVVTGIFLITLTNEHRFMVIAFEVASAFGTVGLSMGITADLDPFGRAVIIVIMFVGRVGPLALGFMLATSRRPKVRYPESQIYLG